MAEPSDAARTQRIDQWLWFARIVKSRTLGQALIERGKVRINRVRTDKCSQTIKSGDVVTVGLGPKVRVLQISAMGVRRGPASEAEHLYVELTPMPGETKTDGVAGTNAGFDPGNGEVRTPGAGRPTKRDRRAIDKLKGFGR